MLKSLPLKHISSYGYYFFYLLCIVVFTKLARHESLPLGICYIALFVSYLGMIFYLKKNHFFYLGILARLLLCLSLPTLSDDIYRFIWDGHLLQNGIHPFEHLPNFYLDKSLDGITYELYEHLNSPNYFTVYPPLNQGIFWLSVKIGQNDWLFSANVIRIVLIIADIGSYFLLKKLLIRYKKSAHLAKWYFINPLVIIEFTGNLHFEGLVIFFVLMGLYFYEINKNYLSGIAMGVAMGLKLLPLIYLPYLFLKGIQNKKWNVSLIAFGIFLLSLAFLLNKAFIDGMTQSLELYFKKFEFNASIYYLCRYVGYYFYGYNRIAQIGPSLSIITLIAILLLSVIAVYRQWSIAKTLLFILSTYLCLSTTVHPWYILALIPFGLLSGYSYPIVWSFTIFITYAGYSQKDFNLPIFFIFLEYFIVGFIAFLELKENISIFPIKKLIDKINKKQ